MNILIGCEESGAVREAFAARGHFVVSCDFAATRVAGWHIQCDVRYLLRYGWDMGIFFSPCTRLANSSNKHLYIGKSFKNGIDPVEWMAMEAFAALFNDCLDAPINKICCENPIQHCHARERIRKYDQIVQPHWFGHREQKATCLWLKNLPPLRRRTWIPKPYDQKVWRMGPSPTRQRDRSATKPGMALAMAEDWG